MRVFFFPLTADVCLMRINTSRTKIALIIIVRRVIYMKLGVNKEILVEIRDR